MDPDSTPSLPQAGALRFLSYAIMALGGRSHAHQRAQALLWISKAACSLQGEGMLLPAERARLAAAYAVTEDAGQDRNGDNIHAKRG